MQVHVCQWRQQNYQLFKYTNSRPLPCTKNELSQKVEQYVSVAEFTASQIIYCFPNVIRTLSILSWGEDKTFLGDIVTFYKRERREEERKVNRDKRVTEKGETFLLMGGQVNPISLKNCQFVLHARMQAWLEVLRVQSWQRHFWVQQMSNWCRGQNF